MGKKTSISRRNFFAKVGQGTALAATGGLVWSYLLTQQARATPFAIRPPGALDDADFNARCIKCGQCVDACPYDTLKLATADAGVPIGTPYYIPRETPCYMCEDIPCVPVCPTGALDHALENIDDARMGLADRWYTAMPAPAAASVKRPAPPRRRPFGCCNPTWCRARSAITIASAGLSTARSPRNSRPVVMPPVPVHRQPGWIT